MNDSKNSKEFARYRLERAKETLKSAKLLYDNNDLAGATNRAYYSIFYAIRAVLALEPVDFKRHKDVIAYFNKNYIKSEVFPRKMGTKIVQAQTIREDSDYDDEYELNSERTKDQIDTAEELIQLVEEFLNKN